MSDIKPYKVLRKDFEADIYYLTETEGGRQSPIASGYRGQFFYDEKNWGIAQEFIGKDWCNPGESIHVIIQTVNPKCT